MNFKKPVSIGKEYIATIEVDRREGKKLFLKGKVMDKEGKLHCEMDSLFIKAKFNNYYMGKVMKSILLEKKIHDYQKENPGKEIPNELETEKKDLDDSLINYNVNSTKKNNN